MADNIFASVYISLGKAPERNIVWDHTEGIGKGGLGREHTILVSTREVEELRYKKSRVGKGAGAPPRPKDSGRNHRTSTRGMEGFAI